MWWFIITGLINMLHVSCVAMVLGMQATVSHKVSCHCQIHKIYRVYLWTTATKQSTLDIVTFCVNK